ncbi:helix-turn-helix domain-containing protein [Streptomyces iconiensis]|uniref:Helix-turn-helix domain-containing protein n=1 Tax=Streptomyces iconiensis TaxID=1384038 RepID=A0ABT7A7A5_9ACTN|nr:helix-turn-helix domain-containing protein [Streptomyces iconiensis]MDJ1137224.1 helix-turn-helix domain-containing protein [Streptomyces iconiensis]
MAADHEPDVGREVIESGFRVLRALPQSDERRQLSSLAELTRIPRTTVSRLLRQLRRSGAVERAPGGRWAVSPQLLGMGARARTLGHARTRANRVIQELRDQTGATVSLVVPAQTGLVAVEMIPGREELPIDAYAGIEMPDMSAAAMVLDPIRRDSSRLRPFAAAVDEEDMLEGLTCYARLLTLADGQRASLQIAMASRLPAENFAAHVQRAALAIERLAATDGH